MLIRVDPSQATPLFDQIAASVRRGIADGDIGAGEQLPAARALAQSLGVNMHTVLRAYQDLRDEGLIELRRGRGAVVVATKPADNAKLTQLATELAEQAKRLGIDADQAADLVRRRFT